MIDNLLILFEYAGLPIFLVIITFFLKNLPKDKSMTTTNEYYTIAFDIILVCTVGITIFGLSIYNHYKSGKVEWFVVIALLLSFFLLGLTITLTFIIKQLGEDSKIVRALQILFAFSAIIILVYFINYGNSIVPHDNINTSVSADSTNNHSKNLNIDSLKNK